MHGTVTPSPVSCSSVKRKNSTKSILEIWPKSAQEGASGATSAGRSGQCVQGQIPVRGGSVGCKVVPTLNLKWWGAPDAPPPWPAPSRLQMQSPSRARSTLKHGDGFPQQGGWTGASLEIWGVWSEAQHFPAAMTMPDGSPLLWRCPPAPAPRLRARRTGPAI